MTKHQAAIRGFACWVSVAALAATGCQTPMSLFGKKDLDLQAQAEEMKAKSPSPNATADLIDQADRAFQSQQYTQARAHYEQVLRDAPDNSHAHHHLAVIADLEERFADAEEHYQAALLRDGRNSKILSSLAYSYILQGRFEDAEPRLYQARAADPADLNAASNLALLYACRGDREKCEAVARTLGPSEQTTAIVDDMFARASEIRPMAAPEDSKVKLAGGLDFLKAFRKEDNSDLPDGVNRETYELKQLMDAERERSLRERRAREAADPRRRIPSTRDILGVQGTPPADLRDRLAEIDREPTRPTSPSNRRGTTDQSRMSAFDQHAQTAAAPAPAWAQPQTAQTNALPQQARAPWGQEPQQPRPLAGQPAHGRSSQSGVVTADLVEGPQGNFGGPGAAVLPTQAMDSRGSAAPWPTQLDHSRIPAAATPPLGRPQQSNNMPGVAPWSGSNGQPLPQTSSAQGAGLGPVPGQPQPTPMNDARRQAAVMGMGTGLGGMFDRYAYKQPQQTPSGQPPQSLGAPSLQFPSSATEPQPLDQPPAGQFDVSQQRTTTQQWPGTNSRHGAQYPPVQRALPTSPRAGNPAFGPGLPAPPNWQGQTMPTSTPQLSGPGQYHTPTPNGSAAPAPPQSSFSQPYANVQPLPAGDPIRQQHNSHFNRLQYDMMGSPNLSSSDPTSSNPMSLNSLGGNGMSYGPTQTGPTNTNVPYYDRGTGPAAAGFTTPGSGLPPQAPNAAPRPQSLPPGFVQPPPYRGGVSPTSAIEPPNFGNATPSGQIQQYGSQPTSSSAGSIASPLATQRPGTLPQISPRR